VHLSSAGAAYRTVFIVWPDRHAVVRSAVNSWRNMYQYDHRDGYRPAAYFSKKDRLWAHYQGAL
jgi:hypothetical protein